MASREIITLVDDLDGSEATQRVPFALDGAKYEIDLNDANADRLRAVFHEYTRKGRRTGGRKQRTHANPANATTTATREQTGIDAGALRMWANENGFNLSGRGRIPAAVVEAYREAHPDNSTSAPGKRARKTPPPPRKVAERKSAAKSAAKGATKGGKTRGRARS